MIMAVRKLPFSEKLSMATACTSRRIGFCPKFSNFVERIRATPSEKTIFLEIL
jgi:hypothetical protein